GCGRAARSWGGVGVIGSRHCRGGGRGGGVGLPGGALGGRGGGVCASLKGLAFEPCFHLEKLDARSFRGSWMGFAYCDFPRRMSVAGVSPHRHSSEPLPLEAREGEGPN